MKKNLDLTTWNRKEHFEFFKNFEEPFFGLVATVDCTKAYNNAKLAGVPFFIYYLHKTLVAVNNIESFRYRINGDDVVIYDRIDASSTILRDDHSFGFSFIEFNPDIQTFTTIAQTEIERVRNTSGLFTREFNMDNLIHFSSIPWVNFTSLSHARSFTFPDSCPKISFGKMTLTDEKREMPVSVHIHHGLADGYHVGLFFEELQKQLDN
ncbi:chloramphenicol acetyltransferase [Flavobacterium cerinum]|uniref:Chloramphenicol acetyltransferase n=1 Tax=Flavobacterium cerinum TaxID=2502784 RepID=A0ABY5ITL9_9FLAO|nr:chloramphenicol acetyltransferase [Flavobacterium cerinum]UUC46135.1 chloramphenicol acetyltransferase [Flavobacterium cerinum]